MDGTVVRLRPVLFRLFMKIDPLKASFLPVGFLMLPIEVSCIGEYAPGPGSEAFLGPNSEDLFDLSAASGSCFLCSEPFSKTKYTPLF